MGKQLNFYLMPSDIATLEQTIRAIEPLYVLHNRSSFSNPQILNGLNHLDGGLRWLFYYIVRQEDIKDVIMKYVPAQKYWTVDVLKSPVVEFHSCYFDELNLRRGRLYYIDKYYGDSNEVVIKPESFQKWAKSILVKTRNSLIKIDNDYFGVDSKKWLDCGGQLIT